MLSFFGLEDELNKAKNREREREEKACGALSVSFSFCLLHQLQNPLQNPKLSPYFHANFVFFVFLIFQGAREFVSPLLGFHFQNESMKRE